MEQNDFLEFLQLEPGEPRLVTKSELLERIRGEGLTISDRQLTFYVTEGLVPKSVRVGSRAGVYPSLVAELLAWILRAREMGVPVEAIKELVPLWKSLVAARNENLLDLAQIEYVARQKVSSLEAVLAVPELLTEVFAKVCPDCRKKIEILAKDGTKRLLDDPTSMIAFAAIVNRADDSGATKANWFAYRRVTLASPPEDIPSDPTTIILGLPPNAPLPGPPSTSAHMQLNGSHSEPDQQGGRHDG